MLPTGDNSSGSNGRPATKRRKEVARVVTTTRRGNAPSPRIDEDMLGDVLDNKDWTGTGDCNLRDGPASKDNDRYVPSVVALKAGIPTSRHRRQVAIGLASGHPAPEHGPTQPATTRDNRITPLPLPNLRRRNLPRVGMGDLQVLHEAHSSRRIRQPLPLLSTQTQRRFLIVIAIVGTNRGIHIPRQRKYRPSPSTR